MVTRFTDILSSTSKEINISTPLDYLFKAGYIQQINNHIVFLPLMTKIIGNLEKLSLNYFNVDQVVFSSPHFLQEIVEFHLQSYKRLPKKFAMRYNTGSPSANLWETESELLTFYTISAEGNKSHIDLLELWRKIGIKVQPVQNYQEIAYMYLHPRTGVKNIAYCNHCNTYNFISSVQYSIPLVHTKAHSIEKIYTPNTKTITELCNYLQISPEQTAKIVFYQLPSEFTLKPSAQLLICVVRGDRQINELRIQALIDTDTLLMADEQLIREVGAYPGFASPIGITTDKCYVLVDPSVELTPNLVAGANEENYHLLHTNYGRDYIADQIAILTDPIEGDACTCGYPLSYLEGSIIATYGIIDTTSYTKFMGKNGKPQSYLIQQFTLYLERILATYVESHTDTYGLILNYTFAPFDIHLIVLGEGLESETQNILQLLSTYDILLDDRKGVKAGEKFADADLLGIPIRLVISKKLLPQNKIEIKFRNQRDKHIIPITELQNFLKL